MKTDRGAVQKLEREKSEAKQDASCVKTGQRTAKKNSRADKMNGFLCYIHSRDYIDTFFQRADVKRDKAMWG